MRYIPSFLMLLFLTACVTTQQTITAAPDHLTCTSSPALSITIDDSFLYLGRTDTDELVAKDKGLALYEQHLYVTRDKVNHVQALLAVNFLRVAGGYTWSKRWLGASIYRGEATLTESRYTTGILIFFENPYPELAAKLQQEGYDLIFPVISKSYTLDVGHGNTRFIAYSEPIDIQTAARIEKWRLTRRHEPSGAMSVNEYPMPTELMHLVESFESRADSTTQATEVWKNFDSRF